MKKTITSIIVLSFLLTSCVQRNDNFEVSRDDAIKSNRFVVFENHYGYQLVYDQETGVEYYYAPSGSAGADFLTPLLDKDGKPKIHKGYNYNNL